MSGKKLTQELGPGSYTVEVANSDDGGKLANVKGVMLTCYWRTRTEQAKLALM